MNITELQDSTILIVDDNADNLNVLLATLTQAGFTVLAKRDGENALELAKRKPPDLILLDILMPGISGFETCRRLKEDETTQDIPVIFMSALTDTVDKVKGFELGAVDYITKPFQHEEVLARVKAHLTIVHQRRQLQELNANKDKFFSILAHDLRNPFSSLQMLIQFTLDNLADSGQTTLERTMEKLQSSTDNVYDLLENLLTWSRIQRGVMEYQPRPVHMHEVVNRNLALLTSQAAQKQIALSSKIEEDIVVSVDAHMVDAIVRNLLTNAIKFTHSGGRVSVSVTQDEHDLRVSVSDTGLGIGEEHISKLFQIGSHYKRFGTAQEKGTGMGLILCKEFVAQHGGTIWVESEVDHGSTFIFTLPRQPTNDEAQ